MPYNVLNEGNFEQLVENSRQKPVFLLKHSTACGISAAALREFDRFERKNQQADFWIVLVREQRPISLLIAKKTGIEHQSPQVILFYKGAPVWNESHMAITEEILKMQLSRLKIAG